MSYSNNPTLISNHTHGVQTLFLFLAQDNLKFVIRLLLFMDSRITRIYHNAWLKYIHF